MSKVITVTTDSPTVPTLRLRFDVNVITPVKVLPQMRLSLSGVEGTAASDGVLLTRIDGQQLIAEVASPEPPLEVSIVPATGPEAPTAAAQHGPRPGDLWLTASLPGSAAPTSRSGALKLRTNHPDVPELEVPYVVRVRPTVEARPAQVQLWVSEEEQAPSASVLRLVHNGREAFPVSAVTSSHPDVFTAGVSDSGEPAVAHNIWIRLADGVGLTTPLPVQGVVRVGLGGDPERILEVPVVVATRRGFRRGQQLQPTETPYGVAGSPRAGSGGG